MADIYTESYRGIPPGKQITADNVALERLSPRQGNLPLPVLTLDIPAFDSNAEAMMDYCKQRGVGIAPHAKTPMAPRLAQRLVQAGAWGASVANVQQAAVLLEHGIERLILSNEIGGLQSGEFLGTLLRRYPNAQVLAFADSAACLDALSCAGRIMGRPMPVLLEFGAGRAGIRDMASFEALLTHALSMPQTLEVQGIGLYEGSVEAADEAAKVEGIRRLLSLGLDAAALLQTRCGIANPVFTAGGSSYFDLVCDAVATRPELGLNTILRSGAIFFFDHGVYERALTSLAQRDQARDAGRYLPALRVWAQVLSHPEPGLFICSMGKRDVSHDLDLPRPLATYREGRLLPGAAAHLRVAQLNDQHAYLEADVGAPALAVGDVIEFGISHPCTCLDKWRLIHGMTDDVVVDLYPTYFG